MRKRISSFKKIFLVILVSIFLLAGAIFVDAYFYFWGDYYYDDYYYDDYYYDDYYYDDYYYDDYYYDDYYYDDYYYVDYYSPGYGWSIWGRRARCTCTNWSSWRDQGCGQGECAPTQMYQIRTRSCGPCSCALEREVRCVERLACRPTPQNDPVSGTLSVNSTSVCVGEPIVISITGQDDDGLYKFYLRHKGVWKKQYVSGTSTTRSWTVTERYPGTYTFCGRVEGYKITDRPRVGIFSYQETIETANTSPYCVDVTVSCPPCP